MALLVNTPGETKTVAIGLGKMPNDPLHPHIAIAPTLSAHFQIPLTLASSASVLAIILQVTHDLAIKKEGLVV